MSVLNLLLVTVMLFAQPPSAAELQFEIGAVVPRQLLRAGSKSAELVMTQSAQLDPCFQYQSEGVKYTIAFSEKSRKISYIHTEDSKFRTSDGLQVGSSIQ